KELPLYSYDYDANYPEVATRFKKAISDSDAILFVTPEYNRSIPGALKNAIDWGSRPWGTNSFAQIPSGVIGTSPGAIGTAVAQQSLRSVLSFCNSPQMNAPEAYIQFKPGLITDDGEVTDQSTAEFLRNYMAEFDAFITRVYTVIPKTRLARYGEYSCWKRGGAFLSRRATDTKPRPFRVGIISMTFRSLPAATAALTICLTSAAQAEDLVFTLTNGTNSVLREFYTSPTGVE